MRSTVNVRTLVAAAAVLVVAAAATAGDSSVKVKKLGSAEVRFNAVGYRAELMSQLAPGLTWRLGKDGPTRLKLEKMALVGPRTVLLPGEATLNLRYWSMRKWELVVFAEKDWKWSEDKTQLGVIAAYVGTHKDVDKKKGKNYAKALELELHQATRGTRTEVPRPALTGDDALLELFEDEEDVAYGPDLQSRFEALPLVELITRFGPFECAAHFEPTAVVELKGERTGADGKKVPLALSMVQLNDPGVRTSFLEDHEGALPLGVLTKGAPSGSPVLLTFSGGEMPLLYVSTRNGAEDLHDFEGERVATKADPKQKTLTADLDGNTLTVHAFGADYVFKLW